MDRHDLWLSDDEQVSEEDDQNEANPASFALGLEHQGPRGGKPQSSLFVHHTHTHTWAEFRIRNRTPGQIQRSAVSAFQGGRDKRRPAFTVSCNALAMIHGQMGPHSPKQGTLLVYEFKFNSYRGTRIKNADIVFEFRPQPGWPESIAVADLRPNMETRMAETEQTVTDEINARVGTEGMQIGMQLGGKHSIQRVKTYHTVVIGDNPQDAWGNRYTARFSLAENPSRKDGIITRLRTAILLEREGDENFFCHPCIKVEPNFSAYVATLGTTRDPDDPIQFSVKQPPFNLLKNDVSIDQNNLKAANLDALSECTFYHLYEGAVKHVT